MQNLQALNQEDNIRLLMFQQQVQNYNMNAFIRKKALSATEENRKGKQDLTHAPNLVLLYKLGWDSSLDTKKDIDFTHGFAYFFRFKYDHRLSADKTIPHLLYFTSMLKNKEADVHTSMQGNTEANSSILAKENPKRELRPTQDSVSFHLDIQEVIHNAMFADNGYIKPMPLPLLLIYLPYLRIFQSEIKIGRMHINVDIINALRPRYEHKGIQFNAEELYAKKVSFVYNTRSDSKPAKENKVSFSINVKQLNISQPEFQESGNTFEAGQLSLKDTLLYFNEICGKNPRFLTKLILNFAMYMPNWKKHSSSNWQRHLIDSILMALSIEIDNPSWGELQVYGDKIILTNLKIDKLRYKKCFILYADEIVLESVVIDLTKGIIDIKNLNSAQFLTSSSYSSPLMLGSTQIKSLSDQNFVISKAKSFREIIKPYSLFYCFFNSEVKIKQIFKNNLSDEFCDITVQELNQRESELIEKNKLRTKIQLACLPITTLLMQQVFHRSFKAQMLIVSTGFMVIASCQIEKHKHIYNAQLDMMKTVLLLSGKKCQLQNQPMLTFADTIRAAKEKLGLYRQK